MPGWEAKENGERIFAHCISNNFFCRFTKWNVIVAHIIHAANYQTCKILQLATPFQVHHHTIYVIEIFIKIFDEKYFTGSVEISWSSAQGIKYGKVTTNQFSLRLAFAVETLRY